MTADEVVRFVNQHPLHHKTASGVGRFGFHRGGQNMSDLITIEDFVRYNGQPETVHLTAGITLYWVEFGRLPGFLHLHEFTLSPHGEWVHNYYEGGWQSRLKWLRDAFAPEKLPPEVLQAYRELDDAGLNL